MWLKSHYKGRLLSWFYCQWQKSELLYTFWNFLWRRRSYYCEKRFVSAQAKFIPRDKSPSYLVTTKKLEICSISKLFSTTLKEARENDCDWHTSRLRRLCALWIWDRGGSSQPSVNWGSLAQIRSNPSPPMLCDTSSHNRCSQHTNFRVTQSWQGHKSAGARKKCECAQIARPSLSDWEHYRSSSHPGPADLWQEWVFVCGYPQRLRAETWEMNSLALSHWHLSHPASVMILIIILAVTLAPLCSGGRSVRYVEWSPPVVHPQRDQVTVQARQNYTLSCEGHKPVSWHLPEHTQHSDIMSRYETLGNQGIIIMENCPHSLL